MHLIAGWKERLENLTPRSVDDARPLAVPRCPRHYARRVTYVETEADARAMHELACQRRIAFIGIDTEFRYDKPGVPMKGKQEARDPRSVHPLLLSVSLVEP